MRALIKNSDQNHMKIGITLSLTEEIPESFRSYKQLALVYTNFHSSAQYSSFNVLKMPSSTIPFRQLLQWSTTPCRQRTIPKTLLKFLFRSQCQLVHFQLQYYLVSSVNSSNKVKNKKNCRTRGVQVRA